MPLTYLSDQVHAPPTASNTMITLGDGYVAGEHQRGALDLAVELAGWIVHVPFYLVTAVAVWGSRRCPDPLDLETWDQFAARRASARSGSPGSRSSTAD